LFFLEAPYGLRFLWNRGILLGFVWLIQVGVGILLLLYYGTDFAFFEVELFRWGVIGGELLRGFHVLFGSVFFILIYFHVFRGIWVRRFRLFTIWIGGFVLLIGFIGVAFLGYVLPFGQISFWGAIVIINFIRVIPLFGGGLVEWVWGGYLVNLLTLKLFLVFHFFNSFNFGSWNFFYIWK